MQIDVAAVRADSPACEAVVHLNNCGSSLPPDKVTDAVVDYLRLESRIGGYEAASKEEGKLNRVYDEGAQMLGCRPSELAFVSGAAEAWWRAFSSVPLEAGDRILTASSEYQANGFGLLQARQRGVEVDVIPNDPSGTVDLELMAKAMDERVKLVCLTQVAMSNGGVQPAAEVGKLAKDVGAIYLLDACQAVGQMVVDVDDLQCDFLAFTGRKFMRGPRGTGMLYARTGVLNQLLPSIFIDGASAVWTSPDSYELLPGAKRFEFGEYPYAAKVGLGEAIAYANAVGLDAIEGRVAELASRLREGLSNVSGVAIQDQGDRLSGIVTFTVEGHDAMRVFADLQARGINTGAPGAANAQLDMAPRGLSEVVRAGIHYFNTEEEIDLLVQETATIASS